MGYWAVVRARLCLYFYHLWQGWIKISISNSIAHAGPALLIDTINSRPPVGAPTWFLNHKFLEFVDISPYFSQKWSNFHSVKSPVKLVKPSNKRLSSVLSPPLLETLPILENLWQMVTTWDKLLCHLGKSKSYGKFLPFVHSWQLPQLHNKVKSGKAMAFLGNGPLRTSALPLSLVNKM